MSKLVPETARHLEPLGFGDIFMTSHYRGDGVNIVAWHNGELVLYPTLGPSGAHSFYTNRPRSNPPTRLRSHPASAPQASGCLPRCTASRSAGALKCTTRTCLICGSITPMLQLCPRRAFTTNKYCTSSAFYTHAHLTHHSRYRLRIRCPRHHQSSTTLKPHLPTGSWCYLNHLHTHTPTQQQQQQHLSHTQPPHTHRCTSTRTTSTATPMAAQQLTRMALSGSSTSGGQARKLTFERPSATSTWISVSQFGLKKCSHCSLHRSPAPASSRRRLE